MTLMSYITSTYALKSLRIFFGTWIAIYKSVGGKFREKWDTNTNSLHVGKENTMKIKWDMIIHIVFIITLLTVSFFGGVYHTHDIHQKTKWAKHFK